MSLENIQKLINSLAKTAEDNYKIATPVLAIKLAKSLEAYPHDQTIGAMSQVIEKMASNNNLFICRSDLKELYKKLYSRNTKFAQLFKDELGTVEELPTPVISKRDDAVELNPYEVADPILSNALSSVFDKKSPLKLYSQALANKAQESVSNILDSWGVKPTSLDVNDGSDKFLLLKADYETPKGITSIYIPIEIKNNKINQPSVFVCNTGSHELNNKNIKHYVTANAGMKLKVTGSAILDILTKASSENREISDTELALTRLNAIRQGKSEFFQNQIVGQKIEEKTKEDISILKSDEFVSFEKQFTSPIGLAEFKFGNNVKIARENIVRDLIGYGYKNPQVVVNDHNDSTIFYAVSLDAGKVAFTIPVKVENGKINKPSIMLCNGAVSDFSKDGINALYINNDIDYKAAASASPLFELNTSDLINNIREAVKEGNHSKAEDALNVLANSGDQKSYSIGFQIYLQGLGVKTASEPEYKCGMIINSNASQYPICGHTGLPIHKVYQDKE